VDETGQPVHVALAQQADILVIIPATTNIIAKMAHGIADDLVTTTAMTFTNQPILIVPAMNTRMWKHPMTQKNLEILQSLDNVSIVPPSNGTLACGEIGEGHIAEQEMVLHHIYKLIHPQVQLFKGLHCLVTAGGTQEPIDPVRVLTNRSSGKMGIALADELFGMGAEVTLISTNNQLQRPYPIVYVERAEEMRIAVENRFSGTDILIMAAAVSDYYLKKPAKEKIRRTEKEDLSLNLIASQDILGKLGQQKKNNQLLIGFAAESQHLFQSAREKLERKNLDMIVANDISRSDIGFNSDFNEVTLLFRDKEQFVIPRAPKDQVAQEVLLQIHRKFLAKKTKNRNGAASSIVKR
jgi:phosphopantothenoylcysteine decarboxylase/phosphopantothenate--cysteine ligase